LFTLGVEKEVYFKCSLVHSNSRVKI
jgi:hypothetical protein